MIKRFIMGLRRMKSKLFNSTDPKVLDVVRNPELLAKKLNEGGSFINADGKEVSFNSVYEDGQKLSFHVQDNQLKVQREDVNDSKSI